MVYGVSDAFLDLSHLAKVTKRAVTQIVLVRDIKSKLPADSCAWQRLV